MNVTLFGRALVTDEAAHWLSRSLPGSVLALDLPLCWDAEARQRLGADYDADLWFVSWDHEVIDPTSLVFATSRERVTCVDCLGWLHA